MESEFIRVSLFQTQIIHTHIFLQNLPGPTAQPVATYFAGTERVATEKEARGSQLHPTAEAEVDR